MANTSVAIKPQVYARVGGLLYLIIIVAGIAGELLVRGSMVVTGDAAATAHHIIASPLLWRAGIAGDLLMHLCDVGVMLALYVLLRPTNGNLALLALLFNVVTTAVLVANKTNLLLPLFLLGDAAYLKTAFTPQQLEALAYLSIRMHDYGFGFGLIFFGVECFVTGYLVFQSGYLPKVLGILMQCAGACYLTNSIALLLYPPLAAKLFPAVMLPAFVAELSLALWLVVKGVDLRKWAERVSAPVQGS